MRGHWGLAWQVVASRGSHRWRTLSALSAAAVGLMISTSVHAQMGSPPGHQDASAAHRLTSPALGWQVPAVDLDQFGPDAVNHQIVVDSKGIVTAVWDPGGGRPQQQGVAVVIQASRLIKGRWTTPIAISNPGEQAFHHDLVVDRSGVVTVIWRVARAEVPESADGYRASRFENGSWSTPERISPAGADAEGARMAVDNSGNVTVVWSKWPQGGVQAVRYEDGAWSAAVDIAPSSTIGYPAVAADASGAVTAVWEVGNYTRGSRGVMQASHFADGEWSTPVEISLPAYWPASVFDAQVVVDASGVATAAWVRDEGRTATIQTSRFMDNAWTPPVDISPNELWSHVPQLAIDSEGTVTALWKLSGDESSQGGVQAARLMNGTWTSPADVVERGTSVGGSAMAVDSKGRVTVMLSTSDASSVLLQSARYEDDSWSTPVTLSPSGVNAATPRIVVGPRDDLFVMWRQTYYIGGVLRFLQYVASPPPTISIACDVSILSAGRKAECSGKTTGIDSGKRLRIFTKKAGSQSWIEASRRSRPVIQVDGTFRTTIDLGKGRTVRIYASYAEFSSHVLTIR